jgi:hypothetical protein
MKTTKPLTVALALWGLAGAAAVLSQELRWLDGKVRARPVTAGLEQEFRALVSQQSAPIWIGYAMPAIEGNHRICYDSDGSMNTRDKAGQAEGNRARRVVVLFRVAEQRVSRIRVFSEDYELIVVDAGGLPVHWLTGVRPDESITFLASLVKGADHGAKVVRKQAEVALAAIAFHHDPAADRALEQFIAPDQPVELRKNTAFWLGNLRGKKGCEIVRQLARNDPSEKVREHCVFALSLSKVPEAVGAMVEAARTDPDSHVRRQAVFWLSQKAGEKAAQAIADAVQNDPEAEVKKQAVFALSQLPKADGIPKLIEVARSNRDGQIRKEAMFWLGQSKDSRALAFFEEVLMR